MKAGKESESGEIDDNVEMKIPNPVKIEKLPASLKETKMNLELEVDQTRDNDYARLLKALQQTRRKQALAANQSGSKSPSPPPAAIDPMNLIASSGINAAHGSSIPKLALMEPISKVLKPQYGVGYKDPKAQLQGEPYENRTEEKNRMTRAKFNEVSQTKILREDASKNNTLNDSLDFSGLGNTLINSSSVDQQNNSISLPDQSLQSRRRQAVEDSFNSKASLNMRRSVNLS